MKNTKNAFIKKKFLIYGLGKSGISSYLFLKEKNELYLYDDDEKKIFNKKIKNLIIKKRNIVKLKFDFIVISPGIDVNKCNLQKILKNNSAKIITDLDIFYNNYYANKNITITGTNGKSTTAKILFEILRNQNIDVRLTGNIGNPILLEKNISKKTVFIIEASSYQIEYSQNFNTDYAVILNISPDHLERHGTFKKYIESKFKLLTNQTKKDFCFLDCDNELIKREIKKRKIDSKIIKVNINFKNKDLLKVNNSYFYSKGNSENLLFILEVIKKFRINKKKLFKIINNFKGLKFRQEIIFKSKEFTLINDSKATTFASSENILKSLNKVYWIVGGIPKKGDKFQLIKKDCLNFKVYIFGKNKKIFIKNFKNKIDYQTFYDLKAALKKVIKDLRIIRKPEQHKTILFSPAAASFDQYKNFEDRGQKFNNLCKELNLNKKLNVR